MLPPHHSIQTSNPWHLHALKSHRVPTVCRCNQQPIFYIPQCHPLVLYPTLHWGRAPLGLSWEIHHPLTSHHHSPEHLENIIFCQLQPHKLDHATLKCMSLELRFACWLGLNLQTLVEQQTKSATANCILTLPPITRLVEEVAVGGDLGVGGE